MTITKELEAKQLKACKKYLNLKGYKIEPVIEDSHIFMGVDAYSDPVIVIAYTSDQELQTVGEIDSRLNNITALRMDHDVTIETISMVSVQEDRALIKHIMNYPNSEAAQETYRKKNNTIWEVITECGSRFFWNKEDAKALAMENGYEFTSHEVE